MSSSYTCCDQIVGKEYSQDFWTTHPRSAPQIQGIWLDDGDCLQVQNDWNTIVWEKIAYLAGSTGLVPWYANVNIVGPQPPLPPSPPPRPSPPPLPPSPSPHPPPPPSPPSPPTSPSPPPTPPSPPTSSTSGYGTNPVGGSVGAYAQCELPFSTTPTYCRPSPHNCSYADLQL